MKSPWAGGPMVTAGVPVRGGGRFLRARLENLLGQKFPRLEILVSDDGSEDDSPAIAEEFARRHPQIRVFTRKTPLGVGGNFGWLTEQARGKYFFLAAQDDLHDQQFVSRCVEVLERDPELWGVSIGWKYMDDEGRPVDWPAKDSFLMDTRGRGKREKLGFFMAGASGGYLYSFWRLAPFRAQPVSMVKWGSHPFYEYPWILGVLLRGAIGRIDEPLFTYRLHLGGGPAPAPHPKSAGLTIPDQDWRAFSDAEKARFFSAVTVRWWKIGPPATLAVRAERVRPFYWEPGGAMVGAKTGISAPSRAGKKPCAPLGRSEGSGKRPCCWG